MTESFPSSGAVKIIVKPNSPKNKIISFDECRNAYRVEIKAKPEDNKANIEVIKFFSRLTGRQVRIINGLKSKEKTLKIC